MLELVALIFEDDTAALSPAEADSVSQRASTEVIHLACSHDYRNETAAIRLYMKETGSTLRQSIQAVDILKSLRPA